jgi:basic membrane protein A
MRKFGIRSRLALLTGAAIVVAACSSAGASPSAAPSAAASGGSALKIGLVTDVGTLNDKSFNEYSWLGAQDGATKIGAPAPKSAISQASADIAKNIQSFVDQKFDIIVTIGFAAGADTIAAAKANPNIWFIGVDQAPCVTETGDNDPTFACKGDAATLLPKLQGIGWKEQQPGYLAGIVAGAISKTGTIAGVGGTAVIPAVVNYLEGYKNGAKSVNPDVKVEVQYVSAAPDKAAFNDPAGGKAFSQQMLSTNADIDVFFQVAGATGNGVLQTACDAGIWGIGVDVDQYVSAPATAKCTVTSAEKKLTKNVSDAIVRIRDGKQTGGTVKLDLTTDDVGLASYHEHASLITADTQKKIDDAIAAIKSGSLKPCTEDQFGNCPKT